MGMDLLELWTKARDKDKARATALDETVDGIRTKLRSRYRTG